RLASELGQHAENAWIAAVADGDALVTVALRDKIERIKADLLADGASPLESLLAEHIAVRWLGNHALEILFAHDRTAANEKRVNRAGKQFERAITCLAVARGLLDRNNDAPRRDLDHL
ncbi:MAG: hypothetical protein N2C14_32060, partial [Planctomycetales bacterium]